MLQLANFDPDPNLLNITVNIGNGAHTGQGQVNLFQPGFFSDPELFPANWIFSLESEWPWEKVVGQELSLLVAGVPYADITVSIIKGEGPGSYSAIGKSIPLGGYKGAPFEGAGGTFVWNN